MPLSPLVIKLSFYLPSHSNRAKNVANVNYIATRPGVDKGEIEPERGEEIHTQYIAERPGSHGLFNQDGPADLDEVKDELKHHTGVVWRGVVSLREDEAIRINHITRQDWENSLQQSFPEIAEKLNIPESNLRWCAAYHAEAGHPHAHFLFWEHTPERDIGKLSQGETRDLKKTFVRNIYSQERERLLIEKTFYRDELRNGARDILGLKKELDKETEAVKNELGYRPSIPPRLEAEQEQKLNQKIQSISEQLPGHGRMALKFMPEDLKAEIRETADWLLQQPGFKQQVEKYLDAHTQISQIYTTQEKALKEAREKAYFDLRDRLSQDVLKSAVALKYKDFPEVKIELHSERAAKAIYALKNFEVSDSLKSNYKEAAWTARKLGETLIKLEMNKGEVKLLITAFAKEAGLKNADKIVQSLDKEFKFSHISKNDWQRLCKNLNQNLQNPWLAVAKREKKDITIPKLNSAKILKVIATFNTAANSKIDEKEIQRTVSLMSRTLKEFGVGSKQRQAIINNWAERSKLNFSKDKVADICDKHDLSDDKFFLGSKGWNELMKNVGTKDIPENPWEYPMQFNLAGAIWKGVWNSLLRERSKTERKAQQIELKRKKKKKRKKEERTR
jgi:hypothetical protein